MGGGVRVLRAFVGVAGLLALAGAAGDCQFPPAVGTGQGIAETIEAINSARIGTRILYVTAHPDDESSSILTYLARGLHADVALLSLTRGEGGQNALGPEQAPQLGLIRTQELRAATRGYGVKLYFTRAKDFGFSKTAEETEKVWGEGVMQDMVRVIREFRPNFVITNFSGGGGGHGNHQVEGLWTPKAVQLAADPNYLQSDPEASHPWDGGANPVVILDRARGDQDHAYVMPVDDISALWGKSWREIGLDAFVNHRTQGIPAFIGAPFFRGSVGLIREDKGPFDSSTLEENIVAMASQKDSTCDCVEEMKKVDEFLSEAQTAAVIGNWSAAARALVEAEKGLHAATLKSVPNPEPMPLYNTKDFLAREKKKIDRALELASGIEVIARADKGNIVQGEAFHVSERLQCRKGVACLPGDAKLTGSDVEQAQPGNGEDSKEKEWTVTLKKGSGASAPNAGQGFQYPPSDPNLAPEMPPLMQVVQSFVVDDFPFEVTKPVTHIAATSTDIHEVLPRLVPAYTLAVEPKQAIEKTAMNHHTLAVLLRVHSYSTAPASVNVGLTAPKGWTAGGPVEVTFDGLGDRYAKVLVTPPLKLQAGNYTLTAYAKRGEETFSESLEPLPSMPTLVWEEPSECKVHAFDITVPAKLHVGYITAEAEPIPDSLRMLGIQVDLLNPEALAFGDLSKYDAVIVGVRAYELRSDLPGANQRLLNYVSNGGTLVVQYQRDFAWDKFQYAPYPAKISAQSGDPLPRITDENSPVKFLKPDDPLLNRPNKITIRDFSGWVQERGLYFWSQYDPKYTALLGMNDPGEKELDGALVYTHYGKGMYIYTGLAFFRELPEGVSGAYRLFVNLLSATRPQ